MTSSAGGIHLVDVAGDAALRSERQMIAPLMLAVVAFEKRAARAQARLDTKQLLNLQTANDAMGRLADDMAEVTSEIEILMDGKSGLGPAEDCRSSLLRIAAGLPTLHRRSTL